MFHRLVSWGLGVAVLALAAPAVGQTAARDEALARLAIRDVNAYTHLSVFDDVGVVVNDGRVTLVGFVTMPFKRTDLGKRLAAIDGVVSVTNAIEVLPASTSDGLLRQRVAQAIYMHPAFWHYASMANPPIRIIVSRGRVTLRGTVTSQVDRMLAFALAQVDGALGVTNELRLDDK